MAYSWIQTTMLALFMLLNQFYTYNNPYTSFDYHANDGLGKKEVFFEAILLENA